MGTLPSLANFAKSYCPFPSGQIRPSVVWPRIVSWMQARVQHWGSNGLRHMLWCTNWSEVGRVQENALRKGSHTCIMNYIVGKSRWNFCLWAAWDYCAVMTMFNLHRLVLKNTICDCGITYTKNNTEFDLVQHHLAMVEGKRFCYCSNMTAYAKVYWSVFAIFICKRARLKVWHFTWQCKFRLILVANMQVRQDEINTEQKFTIRVE